MVRTTHGLTLDDLRARREEILRVAAEHGARNLRVFGSVARGEADPGSDIDFLVEMEPGRSVLDFSELILDFEDLLGHPVDVVDARRLSEPAERVFPEAVPL